MKTTLTSLTIIPEALLWSGIWSVADGTGMERDVAGWLSIGLKVKTTLQGWNEDQILE